MKRLTELTPVQPCSQNQDKSQANWIMRFTFPSTNSISLHTMKNYRTRPGESGLWPFNLSVWNDAKCEQALTIKTIGWIKTWGSKIILLTQCVHLRFTRGSQNCHCEPIDFLGSNLKKKKKKTLKDIKTPRWLRWHKSIISFSRFYILENKGLHMDTTL